jgi:tRNA 2-thiouridine synthesizing protein A
MNAASREDVWQNARELDLTGLKCPLPSLMTARALRAMKEGERLAVTVTDPLAPLDLKHLCSQEDIAFWRRPNMSAGPGGF